MPDIEALSTGTVTVDVVIRPDFVVSVDYDPSLHEHALANRLINIESTKDLSAIVDTLDVLMTGWDLTDKGEVIPITTETLGARPPQFLSAILAAIQQDMFSVKNGTSSLNGSSTAAASLPASTSSFAPVGSSKVRRRHGS